jgi:tetratricopeptide (TPR) repeat protein
MYRTTLAIVLTLALAVTNVESCFAKDLIKSLQIETQVYQQVAGAESLISSGQYAAAREILLKAAAQDPTSYSRNVHRNLFLCYRALKQYDKAVSEAKKVLQYDPAYEIAYYDMAQAYYDADKYDQAIDALNKFLAVASTESNRKNAQQFLKEIGSYGFFRKGRTALDADKYIEAKKWLSKAAAYDPSPYSATIHSNLCYVLQQLGESGSAVEEGKRALMLDPNNAQTTYSIGMAYADMLRFDEALQWVNKYASLESDASRRERALECVKGIEDDRNQFNNPNNKKPDYLEVMRGAPKESYVRWAKKDLPIKVYIKPADGVLGYKPAFNNIVKSALDYWCHASGDKLDYKLTSNPAEAKIQVRFTKDPIDYSQDHPNVMTSGITDWQANANDEFEYAIVRVRTVDPFAPTKPVEDGECSHVITHELGHALGLGHSKFIRDLMYFRSARQQSGPTKRDSATLARLYHDYPTLSFVPKQTTPLVPSSPSAPPAFVAPPAFLPPAAPDVSNIVPPMFVPPPAVDDEKLTPPMFVPPAQQPDVAAPMFTPPGVQTKPTPAKLQPAKPATPKGKTEGVPVPFFTPPPAK